MKTGPRGDGGGSVKKDPRDDGGDATEEKLAISWSKALDGDC